jgi:hypothetical protein
MNLERKSSGRSVAGGDNPYQGECQAAVPVESFNVANPVNLGLVRGSFSPGVNGLNANSRFGTTMTARDSRSPELAPKVII